ncbi:unnamed protein product, partial [Amoebophrya sp. A25]
FGRSSSRTQSPESPTSQLPCVVSEPEEFVGTSTLVPPVLFRPDEIASRIGDKE